MFQGSLPHEDNVIFDVSTTGQGDTPDSMKVSWDSVVNIKKLEEPRCQCLVIYFDCPNFPFML